MPPALTPIAAASAAPREVRVRRTPQQRAYAPAARHQELPDGSAFALSITAAVHARFIVALLRLTYGFVGDLATSLVFLEIAARSLDRELFSQSVNCLNDHRELEAMPSADALAPIENAASCNVASIADVTGMARETVRRKTLRLLELGWIARLGAGDVVLSNLGLSVLENIAGGLARHALRTAELLTGRVEERHG